MSYSEGGSTTSLEQRLMAPGPKRLLALDGGGIRGLITLGYLARIEHLLREQHQDPDMVLADYFDLIGGTSTGAVIATALSLGWPVADIHDLYLNVGKTAFLPKKSWFGPVGRILGAKFDDEPLGELFHKQLGERRLDSPDLRTGLLVVVKRADTGSVWALVNVPSNKFFEYNRHMPLWEILRASTAAPTFFRPQLSTDVGGGESAVFVDGGVSMHNNPAMKLLMVANLEGFGLQWTLGTDQLLLCSLGTGWFNPKADKEAVMRFNNLNWAQMLATQLIQDSSELNQILLQWMSESPTAARMDSQVGTLAGDQLSPSGLLTYLRYNIELERDVLNRVGFDFTEEGIDQLREMSNTERIDDLDKIGRLSAQTLIRKEHFPAGFMVRS